MKVLPGTIAVLGSGHSASAAAMKEWMRYKNRPGSLIVHDAAGRGAMILGREFRPCLDKRRVVWVDLADRRRPLSLFAFSRSPHLKNLLYRFLIRLRAISGADIGDSCLNWAANLADSMSADGRVTLGGLLRTMSSSESRRWFLDTNHSPAELARLSRMIEWALHFPSVYSFSEASLAPTLPSIFEQPTALWLEAPVEHFEPREHWLLAAMTDAVLEDLLRSMAADSTLSDNIRDSLTISRFHIPDPVDSPPADWAFLAQSRIRLLSVFRLDREKALKSNALQWASQAEILWVTGKVGKLDENLHAPWLNLVEQQRIHSLDESQVWIRANQTRKSTVVNVNTLTPQLSLAQILRGRSASKRALSKTGQIAAVVDSLGRPKGAHDELYVQLGDADFLRLGWMRVRESRSNTSGVDGVTPRSFQGNLERELQTLAAELAAGNYRARPLRRVEIPKADGGVRKLGIPCVRDRVVQAAVLLLLEPIFEPSFSRYSFAYRPGRNARQAVQIARSMVLRGRHWAVIADIRKCFDSIDHEILLSFLLRKIADEEIIALIRHWMRADVLEFGDIIPSESGIPQGECLSPLLANVYLDVLDRHFEHLGLSFVRYADDLVILTESESAASSALQVLESFLRESLHLELKPAKLQFVPVETGFDFLGFEIKLDGIRIASKKCDSILNTSLDLLRELATGLREGNSADALKSWNDVMRGWSNYYFLPAEQVLAQQLLALDSKMEEFAAAMLDEQWRQNPAWHCRERLLPSLRPNRNKQLETHRNPGLGYPGEQSIASSPNPETPNVPESTPVTREPSAASQGVVLEQDGRLFVMSNGAFLLAKQGDLVVRRKKLEIARIPMDQLTVVSVQGFGIGLSVDVQVQLAQANIPLILAPPLGSPAGILQSVEGGRASLRRAQAIRRDDPEMLRVGLEMISAKVRNQAAILEYFSKYRRRKALPEADHLKLAAASLKDGSRQIRNLDPTLAACRSSVLGFEGRAAAAYWQAISALLPEDLRFSGRITLSATDPVNQCLNYVYGILYSEVWRAVLRAGLDPYFGLVHGSQRDNGSLVFDLIEEFRAPFADRVVLAMLGRGFRPVRAKSGLLNAATRRLLIQAFFHRWRQALKFLGTVTNGSFLVEYQAKSIASAFSGQGRYHAYRMKW